MVGMGRRTGGWALAVLAVGLPIPVGLVLAWQVHWLLVVPAYLLGIPAWLCLVSGTWSLVHRVLGTSAVETVVPPTSTELRLPAPRVEGSVRTPTP